jgi:hypothetical protein
MERAIFKGHPSPIIARSPRAANRAAKKKATPEARPQSRITRRIDPIRRVDCIEPTNWRLSGFPYNMPGKLNTAGKSLQLQCCRALNECLDPRLTGEWRAAAV